MESNAQNPRDIVDTTDSLEAVGACRSMKNFLFVVILIGLMLPQIIFWMNWFGLIEKKACTSCGMQQPSCPEQKQVCPGTVEEKQTTAPAPAAALLPLAATVNVAEEVEKVAGQVQQAEQAAVTVPDEEIILEKETDYIPAEMPAEPAAAEPEEKTDSDVDVADFFRISSRSAKVIVILCNFFVLTAAVLYSLTLLMCLKISLTGRLGGINHIARAFFISLFLMVFLMPWQRLLPGVLVGTVWLPAELLGCGWCKAHASTFWKVLFYLRFTGLWFVAIWLLLWAQTRSAKWGRATLRRLGVIR